MRCLEIRGVAEAIVEPTDSAAHMGGPIIRVHPRRVISFDVDPSGGGSGGYYEALGGAGTTGWDWIINAFTLAREYFPNAKLMLNDFSITNDGNATTRYLQIIQLLKDRGLIDLVGIQGHAFEFNYNNLQGSVNTHTANIARLAEAGLPIYVTEFDIDGVDAIFGVQDDALQLQRYQALFPLFWENEAIKGMTMWGYVQGGAPLEVALPPARCRELQLKEGMRVAVRVRRGRVFQPEPATP